MKAAYPRLVIAGTSGDSGKTIVSLALLLAFRNREMAPVAFKKGPDFIDAAWLGWAAGGQGRNLDTYMMGPKNARRSFFENAEPDQINLIEGNRGIHDGSDEKGTHSTAELAKLLQAPSVLVLPIRKTTRTAAAVVIGCKQLDPELNIKGVVLNQVAGSRHERVAGRSIEHYTGVPIVGAIPKITMDLIPNRHLGLVTLFEFEQIEKIKTELLRIGNKYLDLERLVETAWKAPKAAKPAKPEISSLTAEGLRIGVIKDAAFSFYYPENLEILERHGAKIVIFSALDAPKVPDNLDILYIGGGFPEMHMAQLANNRKLMRSIKKAAENNLPIYAECGGLMYLAESVRFNDKKASMCGVFPLDLHVSKKPQGHGYCEVEVDTFNPFFTEGAKLRGHEFHYSFFSPEGKNLNTAFRVKRGTGCFDNRDGLIYKNVLASYLHLHSTGCPEWAKGIIQAAGTKDH